MWIKNIFANLKRYSFLLQQLVIRDFKVKYKRSVLGILWSLLYPILTMAVMAIVFSNIFKISTPEVNYLAYLLSGLILFNYFSEASTLAMSSIFTNFGLISKVYIPKYIFPLSKCLFVGINFLFTLIPFYMVLFITGTGINWYHIFLPYAYVCVFMFTWGIGLILSAATVFFRDIIYIYGIVIMLWTYLTPIMYDIKVISENLQPFLKFNPMYHYINFVREITLYGRIPELYTWITCLISSVVVLIIGLIIFKKNQDKFISYV